MTDSLLSPPEIAERLEKLGREAFPPLAAKRLAVDIAAFCRGPEAEAALGRLVGFLEPEQVLGLLAAQIRRPYMTAFDLDFTGPGFFLVTDALTRRGFTVTSSAITLPDGTDIAGLVAGDRDHDDDRSRLCRIALLGFWMLDMRTRAPSPPAY